VTPRCVAVLVLLLFAPAAAWSARGLAAHRSEDAEALVRLLVATTDEWNRGNLEAFIAPYARDSTFMTAAGPVGRDLMVRRYREKYFAGGRPLQALRFEELEVRALGPDHALMTGRFVLSGGALAEQSGRFTLVWVRTPEGWRILHDHSS
jgi:ketosteroid isomerase-like protein